MYRPILGHSFAVLVAPIFLFVAAFNLLNKKKAGEGRNAEDAAGNSGSSSTSTETNFGMSSSSTAPTETNNSPFGLSTTPTETDFAGSNSSTTITETHRSPSNLSLGMTKTNSDGSSLSIAPIESKHGAPGLLPVPIRDRYDVFLSFRGPDTRNIFTSHLYSSLVIAGIDVFRDDDELYPGEEISTNILAAIEKSKISIPILSVNYGSSKWCLDELVHMMECKNNNSGHIVWPIFYKVKPSDVRRQAGSFKSAFQKHKKRFDPMILEKWRRALKEVSNLKGWEANGDEGKLVNSIVEQVLSELKKESELTLPEFFVGIDGHVKKIMKFIDNNSSATLFVGIYGMGGIGKTILAKTIYNKLSNKFKHRSYIEDIRDSCQRYGVVHLQNRLVFHILRRENQVDNKCKGINIISSKFNCKKVLILLDDVDNEDQLTALVGNHNWFFPGSIILITTRNKSILENARVNYMYEHQEMDENQSLILFSRHAFRRDFPPSEFENLSHHVVSTTRLPLSLKVLGSSLYEENEEKWKDTIDKFGKIPKKKVLDNLRISYEALEKKHKEMFLDIACFFNGSDGRMASSVWDTYGFSPKEGIEVLRFMSLIKVGDNHELKMHDLLRDLGREIVREEDLFKPHCRSRLWESNEILKVLKQDKGTEKIQAIYLGKHNSEGSEKTANGGGNIHSANQFKKLTSLRLLHVSGALFRGDFENSMELRCLRWWKCPSTFEANNFPVEELVGLDLSRSDISEKWQGWTSIMNAENLKFLDLTSCGSLQSTAFLSAFKNLEVLILRDCKGVEKIDSSIGEIESLVCLDLTGCRRLWKLPAEVGKLKALEQLLLKDNRNISEVPDSIGDLQNLEILNISSTGIKELPYGIRRLIKLRDLDASRCKNLEGDMPESIRYLSSLQHLDFDGCEFLETLDVSCFNHLRTLSAKGCKNIVEVRGLENLKYLESLSITESTSIKRLDLPKSKGLKILVAANCVSLVEIRGLNGLEFLEELYISWCASIERLDLPNSYGLNQLNVRCCNKLISIQGLDRLNFLESLFISECALIDTLNLPKSEDLKILRVENCKNLVKIQGLDGLKFLKELYISGCTSIEWPNLPRFTCPKTIDIKI